MKLSNSTIKQIALEQSAIDANCSNAIKSGLRPAWVEMTVKSAEMVDEING